MSTAQVHTTSPRTSSPNTTPPTAPSPSSSPPHSSPDTIVSVTACGALIPPINYCMVEENLHRSGAANELNLPFLKILQLHTIIFVGPETPPPELKQFCDQEKIKLEQVGRKDHKSQWQPMSTETVRDALRRILDVSKYPLLISCNLGRHRTGTVVACLRKLQRWNLTSVLEEYRRYAGPKVRLFNEQFIELFDVRSVKVPENCPVWL